AAQGAAHSVWARRTPRSNLLPPRESAPAATHRARRVTERDLRPKGLRLLRPARVDEHRVQGGRGGDEQAVLLGAAEGEVRHGLGDADLAEELAFGGVAADAGLGAGPEVAVGVEAEAVEAAGVALGEHAAVGQALAVDDVEDAHVARLPGV